MTDGVKLGREDGAVLGLLEGLTDGVKLGREDRAVLGSFDGTFDGKMTVADGVVTTRDVEFTDMLTGTEIPTSVASSWMDAVRDSSLTVSAIPDEISSAALRRDSSESSQVSAEQSPERMTSNVTSTPRELPS